MMADRACHRPARSAALRRAVQLAGLLVAVGLTACDGSTPGGTTAPRSEAAQRPIQAVIEAGYITLSDGTRLRYHVEYDESAPPGPVLLQYDGYDAGTGGYFSNIPAVKAELMNRGYRILGVSIRGTGCSTGGFDLFVPQWAADGAEAVEWAARQSWSNGDVGMIGYSFPGIMQLFVAALQPPSLRAIAPSNVIFDLYRDVGSPGGIPNAAFSSLFTVQQEAPGATGIPAALEQGDPECAANHALNRAAYQSFVVEGLSSPHIDGAFGWHERSPAATAADIEVPVLNITYWQDEQTGSRIGGLLEPGGLLRTLNPNRTWAVLSNGNHDLSWSHPLHSEMLLQFFERYLGGHNNGWERTPHIQILHELSAGDARPSWITAHDRLPNPQPHALYLQAGGRLSREPSTMAGSDSYLSPLLSTSTNPLPDPAPFLDQLWRQPAPEQGRLVWTTPALEQDLQLFGSASVDLWLSSSAEDTDLQATLTEVRPDGLEVYVARGWLRASKRALDSRRSTPTRPFHAFTEASTAPLTPGEPTLLRLEVFPFAHRFRAGSALRLILDAPVNLTGDWGAFLAPQPALNSILHGPQHPSRLVVGVLRDEQPRPPARDCGELANQPCRESIAPVPETSALRR